MMRSLARAEGPGRAFTVEAFRAFGPWRMISQGPAAWLAHYPRGSCLPVLWSIANSSTVRLLWILSADFLDPGLGETLSASLLPFLPVVRRL